MGVNPLNPVFTAELLSKLNISAKICINKALIKEFFYLLIRHAKGDWGEVSAEDNKNNDF